MPFSLQFPSRHVTAKGSAAAAPTHPHPHPHPPTPTPHARTHPLPLPLIGSFFSLLIGGQRPVVQSLRDSHGPFSDALGRRGLKLLRISALLAQPRKPGLCSPPQPPTSSVVVLRLRLSSRTSPSPPDFFLCV